MMIKKKMWNKYFQIDPLTAPIVLEAFQKYDEGMTMKEIVDYLKLKGLRTKKNGEISINSLTRMLHNRRYIGEYKFQDITTPDSRLLHRHDNQLCN